MTYQPQLLGTAFCLHSHRWIRFESMKFDLRFNPHVHVKHPASSRPEIKHPAFEVRGNRPTVLFKDNTIYDRTDWIIHPCNTRPRLKVGVTAGDGGTAVSRMQHVYVNWG